MTPVTVTGTLSESCGRATAEAVLQATTTVFAFSSRSIEAISRL
jgi:hypothetical protein